MNHSRLQDVAPFDFMGLLIRDPVLDSTSSASVALIEVAPGVSHPQAKSTKSEKLYICIEGSLVFVVDGNRVEVEPIDLLVIRKERVVRIQERQLKIGNGALGSRSSIRSGE